MNATKTAHAIQSREDFVIYLRALACSRSEEPEAWENQDLGAYLNAMAAWVEDMDGYFQTRGETIPEQPSWKLLGQILAAARVYE